jgi:thymidine kinase
MSKTRESITGYVGPMFAKKTLLMLDEVTSAEAVGRLVVVFKPDIDTRYGKNIVRSRAGGRHHAIPIPADNPETIYGILSRRRLPTDLVAFDEIQFIDPKVVGVILDITQSGIPVVYCGLIRDYRGNAFLTMEKLLPLTTKLVTAEAKCMFPLNGTKKLCGADAVMTQRLFRGEPDSYYSPTVVIEKKKDNPDYTYQARCLEHWQVADFPSPRQINFRR